MKFKTDRDFSEIIINGEAIKIANGIIDIEESYIETLKTFGFNEYIEEEIDSVKEDTKPVIRKGKKNNG